MAEGTRATLDNFLNQLTAARTKIRQRIADSNATTTREVMAAGKAVSQIVDLATDNIAHLKSTVSLLEEQGRSAAENHDVTGRYAGEFSDRISAQVAAVGAAIERTGQIASVASKVRGLAGQAHILSLNARIEAAHSNAGGSAFSVIATEMKELSIAIGAANESIGALAANLNDLLPKLVAQVSDMRALTQRFSADVTTRVAQAEADGESLRSRVTETMSLSDGALERIVRASHDSLSHLQFQDTVSQGLARMDAWLHDLERDLCEKLGAVERLDKIAPVLHEEIGGDKAIDQAGAGEVLLF